MGMFDYIKFGIDRLPVSDEEKLLLSQDEEIKKWGFQTKSFDLELAYYTLSDSDVLIKREHGIEGATIIGDLDYYAEINFYSDVDWNWFEFTAEFANGKLVKITRLNEWGQPIATTAPATLLSNPSQSLQH